LTDVLIYLDVAGPLLGLLYCFISKGRKAEGYYYIISFLASQLFTNGIAKIMMITGAQNNIILYKLNALLGLIAVSAWFINHFKKKLSAKANKSLLVYISASILILIVVLLWENSSSGLNSLSLSFTAFTICILAVLFFLLVFINQYDEKLLKNSQFWTATSFFTYYALCFYVFLAYKILHIEKANNFTYLWLIHNCILFTCCISLAVFSKKIRLWKS
jgi:hypothetical protein